MKANNRSLMWLALYSIISGSLHTSNRGYVILIIVKPKALKVNICGVIFTFETMATALSFGTDVSSNGLYNRMPSCSVCKSVFDRDSSRRETDVHTYDYLII